MLVEFTQDFVGAGMSFVAGDVVDLNFDSLDKKVAEQVNRVTKKPEKKEQPAPKAPAKA